jgi:hypothetical protein
VTLDPRFYMCPSADERDRTPHSHCADLPYLWGGDGTERHIWASGDAYGVAWDAPAATEQPALDETQQEGRGFTPGQFLRVRLSSDLALAATLSLTCPFSLLPTRS